MFTVHVLLELPLDNWMFNTCTLPYYGRRVSAVSVSILKQVKNQKKMNQK